MAVFDQAWRKDLKRRIKQAWFPLTFIGLLAWLDWIMHRSLLFILVVGGATTAAFLYRKELAQHLQLTGRLRQLPPIARALIRATPPLLWFLVRGQGTSGVGWLVVLLVLGSVAAMTRWGTVVDHYLAHFYSLRDRLLSYRTRSVLVLFIPLVTAFGIIHGNPLDVIALIGGPTTQPQAAPGLIGRFILGTIVAIALTALLMRRAATRR
ncbi:hypothetical protein ACFU5O_28185 [Streptomyces sp. NPDC057445]|uniref:hypothetical protein n=1 Tax=Streptomyces sp. NPDC057445 TaxID=3346136 RepID=UPI0036CE81DC